MTDNGAIDIASFKRSGGGLCSPLSGDNELYCYVADPNTFTFGTNCSISNCSEGSSTTNTYWTLSVPSTGVQGHVAEPIRFKNFNLSFLVV